MATLLGTQARPKAHSKASCQFVSQSMEVASQSIGMELDYLDTYQMIDLVCPPKPCVLNSTLIFPSIARLIVPVFGIAPHSSHKLRTLYGLRYKDAKAKGTVTFSNPSKLRLNMPLTLHNTVRGILWNPLSLLEQYVQARFLVCGGKWVCLRICDNILLHVWNSQLCPVAIGCTHWNGECSTMNTFLQCICQVYPTTLNESVFFTL